MKLLKQVQNLSNENKRFLKRITSEVRKVEQSASVILFGSQARGDATSDSDWDILVLIGTNDINLETERKFTFPIFNIEVESGKCINTLIYPRQLWESKYKITPLYENISKEGIVL